MAAIATGTATLAAGMGRRSTAAIVDVIVLGLLFVLIAKAFGTSSGGSYSLNGAPFLAYLLLVLVYYTAMEATLGATLGKLVLGLRVVDARGALPSWGNAATRTLLRIVDGLPFLYLVGFVVALASPSRQRIGDRVAGTMVWRAR